MKKCQDCGTVSNDVEDTICPYDEDINGIETPVTLCPDCISARADEI